MDKVSETGHIDVSCLIPNKNGSKYFPYLQSYFEKIQDLDIEIIVVDDRSTDGSIQLLEAWAKRDPRVKILRNPGNGLVDALNHGLEVANADWVARFDVDDEYSTLRLKAQFDAIEPDTVLLFSDFTLINSQGNIIGALSGPISQIESIVSFFSNRRTPHSSAFFHRESAIKVGKYRKEEFLAEDMGLWMRLSKLGKAHSVPQSLMSYRVSSNSLLSANRSLSYLRRGEIRNLYPFSEYLRDGLDQFPKTSKMIKTFEHSESRLVLHTFELLELAYHFRDYKSAIKLTLRTLIVFKFRHLKEVTNINKLRKKKNFAQR